MLPEEVEHLVEYLYSIKVMKILLNRRLFLGFTLGLFSKCYINNTYANGKPFRDRFQSYRQTFRIEPDPKEAERISKKYYKR